MLLHNKRGVALTHMRSAAVELRSTESICAARNSNRLRPSATRRSSAARESCSRGRQLSLFRIQTTSSNELSTGAGPSSFDHPLLSQGEENSAPVGQNQNTNDFYFESNCSDDGFDCNGAPVDNSECLRLHWMRLLPPLIRDIAIATRRRATAAGPGRLGLQSSWRDAADTPPQDSECCLGRVV